MKQAVGLHRETGAMNPGRMPWAGMRQAVGLNLNSAVDLTAKNAKITKTDCYAWIA